MVLETPYEMALNTAKRFRELRKRKNITIKTVSEKSGVPYSTIVYIIFINGYTMPLLRIKKTICIDCKSPAS